MYRAQSVLKQECPIIINQPKAKSKLNLCTHNAEVLVCTQSTFVVCMAVFSSKEKDTLGKIFRECKGPLGHCSFSTPAPSW